MAVIRCIRLARAHHPTAPALPDNVARAAQTDDLDVSHGDKPVAVVVPVEIYQRFKRMDKANRQALHEAFTKTN